MVSKVRNRPAEALAFPTHLAEANASSMLTHWHCQRNCVAEEELMQGAC